MLGVHVDLKPMLVKEYSESFELIVVEVEIGNTRVRVMTGYGPQENWEEAERTPFFEALESEVVRAELESKSVIISMDANSKLGSQYIKGDPHVQTSNGRLLAGILDRHALIVTNGLVQKRVGIIIRERTTSNGLEQSVIDFVIMSSDLIKHLEYIHVDDKRIHVLTKLWKSKDGKQKNKVESDHNVRETKINIPWVDKGKKVMEVFNFKSEESLKAFYKATQNTDDLEKIFKTEKSLEVQTKSL